MAAAANNGGCDSSSSSSTKGKGGKRLVLIRHGRTHMNEYLSAPGCRWGDPGFTDVFPDPSDGGEGGGGGGGGGKDVRALYRDSPLSPRGISQAKRLREFLSGRTVNGEGEVGGEVTPDDDDDEDFRLSEEHRDVLAEVELVAVSPLTRALQTMELGLLSHLEKNGAVNGGGDDGGTVGGAAIRGGTGVPIVAQPLASERVYLISDLGSRTKDLSDRYPYVDFRSELRPYHDYGEEWWFTLAPEDGGGGSGNAEEKYGGENDGRISGFSPLPPLRPSTYVEWRPSASSQTYSHPGEPSDHFEARMVALYDWLDSRPERTVALVSHWGVLRWLTGGIEFENCEVRVVGFEELKRGGGTGEDEEGEEKGDGGDEDEALAKVGRGVDEGDD